MMSEELPILKGILKGNVSYHNARRCLLHCPKILFAILIHPAKVSSALHRTEVSVT